jgi:hypothetical protein
MTMTSADQWRARGRYYAGLPVLAVMGFQAFARGERIPLLGWIDLAIHEAGHFFFVWAPDLVMFAAGSGLQMFMPLLFAGAFLWRDKPDLLGVSVCLGWAATSFQDASVYIADAPYQRLPLIGGEHDWAAILGPRGLGRLEWAEPLARTVWGMGLLLLLGAMALCLAAPHLHVRVGPPFRQRSASSEPPADDPAPGADVRVQW